MVDSHVHSLHSHDSQQTLEEIYVSARKKGLKGVAITDHVDMWFYDRENSEQQIRSGIEELKEANKKYGDSFHFFQGVEMAEYCYDPTNAERILQLTEYDVILGSVHSVFYQDWADSYSRLDFSEDAAPKEKLVGYMQKYFDKVIEMTEKMDFDVLSHLTCPFRYMNGKYKRGLSVAAFQKQIDVILDLILQREIALEVNTSGIGGVYGEWMPEPEILKRYYAMGGRKITLGSDAHVPENIANGFHKTQKTLTGIGFRTCCHFEKRKPKEDLLMEENI